MARDVKVGRGVARKLPLWLTSPLIWRKQRKLRVPKRRVPFELGYIGLFLQLLSQALMISTLVALWVYSSLYDGLPLPGPSATSASSFDANAHTLLFWGYSILWTTLPAIVIAFYAKFYGAMVDKLKNSQPMMELLHPPPPQRAGPGFWKRLLHRNKPATGDGEKPPKRSTVKRTLLLDYHTYLPGVDSWHAFRNGHYLVSACMLISILFLPSSSIGAAIFSTATVTINSPVTIAFTSVFDGFQPTKKSAMSSFDAASATLVGGASPAPWTTLKYALTPFSISPGTQARLGNMTANTLLYYSALNCVNIGDHDPSLVVSAGGSTGSGNFVTVNYTFTDRGCPVTQIQMVTPFPFLAQAWVEPHCSPSAVDAPDHVRIGLIAGQYDESSATGLANTTLLSCIPSFWSANATVTTAAANSGTSRPGQQLDFTLPSSTAAAALQPLFWQRWLEDIPNYKTTDPGAEYNMNLLAAIAYNLAAARDAGNPFNSTLLLSTFPDAFNAVVAAFVAKWAYKDAATQLRPGIFSAVETRLFVMPATAAAVLAILSLALLSTIWTWIYVVRNTNVLERGVKLMLGHAMLLQGSPDVAEYIEVVKRSASSRNDMLERSDLVEYAKMQPRLRECGCWMDTTDGTIRIQRPDIEHS